MFRLSIAACVACVIAGHAAAEDHVKIGVLKTTGTGPVYIAYDKGYFATAGCAAELTVFESAQPIAVATASGDIDFGYTGFTGGFYGLAAQGALRIVAGGVREVPGVNYQPFIASNRGWEAGLRSVKDYPGHTVGVSQIGSPPHYALGLLAAKYGFDLKTVHLMPLQSIPNIVSAVVGAQVDSGMMPGNVAVPLIQAGKAKLLAWIGDEAPYQLLGMFVSTKTANERHDMIEHCLAALRKGSRDYHDAFIGADEKRKDGPTAAATIAMMAQHTGQSIADTALVVPYVDPEARLDVKDVLRQIAWYRSQGMLKPDANGDAIIDTRYVIPLAAN